MQTASWNDIESDLKLGAFLITVAAQSLVGDRSTASAGFGKAALGKSYDSTQSAASQVDDLGGLAQFDVSGTHFWKTARACFDFVHDETPLDKLDTGDFQDDTLNWMTYFLSAIPRDSYATSLGVHAGRFQERRDRGDESPLPGLQLAAAAKANLADYLQGFPGNREMDLGFAPFEIAALAGMNISSVRNFVGPGGTKPIRSMPSELKLGVYGDPLDTLEWLAGRRNFNAGTLSANWPAWAADRTSTIEDVGALLGIYAWTNRITTDDLADRSGLPKETVRDWTRGTIVSIDDAIALARAAGIDPDLYADLVAQHAGALTRI
nr:helix-turn-helix domain-containing protein [uncultured Devosia sp.]